ncbi:MAG TPA: FemAB family XrtA/PEP-CTERM system-associated protein [Steroidobacter sp.]
MIEAQPSLVKSFEPRAKSSLSVATISDDARAEWDRFIASHASGSFYHLYDWKLINEQALGHECEYLAARWPDGTVEGVLPLVFVKSQLFGRILCSMPFVNYGGPLATTPEATSALLESATRRARDLKASYLELRCPSPLETSMQVSLRKVSLTVPLMADPEALFASFSQKHRKNIRRAQKNNLEVRIGGAELLKDFYSVLEQSWRGLGTPLYSIDYFERILATFPNNTTVYVCSHQNRPINVALTGHYNGTVEGMWAGGLPETRHLDGNYVLYWEMLRHACLQGHQRFHLGRSTADSGAEQFKSKWNARSEQLYWYFYRPDGGSMPELNVDNPKFKLAIAVWRRLPLALTRTIGPVVARLIP